MKNSAANLQDLIPTLAVIIKGSTNLLAKVGIKSCRFAAECFICACMDATS